MRRLALRRLRGDEGLTLLETVVALLVFSLIMTGLAGSMAFLAKTAGINKARSIAVSLAQKYIEEDRAKGASSLELCPGTSPAAPATASFNGQNNLATDIAGTTTPTCLTYQKTKTVGSYSFTVTTLVIYVPNATGKTIGGQPITEKYLDVTLTWTSPRTGRYELSTKLNNNTAIGVTQATGLQFDMQDSNGTKLGNSSVTWHFVVCQSSVTPCDESTPSTSVQASGDTEENGQPLVTLPAGSYTCFLDNTNAQGWVPNPTKNPASDTSDTTAGTIFGPCQVTQDQVLDWVTYWQPMGACSYVSNAKGNLAVYIYDSAGNTLKNASVTINAVTGTKTATLSTTSGSATTGWYANFTGVPPDNYYYNVSLAGYNPVNNAGPTCVLANKNVSSKTSISSVSGCTTAGTNGTAVVNVTDSTGKGVNGATPYFINITTGAVTKFPNTTGGSSTAPGAASKAIAPGAYYYLVSDGTTYDGSGGIGQVCVPGDGASTTFPATLQPYLTNACSDGGTNTATSIKTTDEGGVTTVPNVPVWMIDIDNVGAAPISKSSGASATGSMGNLRPDPYLVIANMPGQATAQVSGYFPTVSAVCVQSGVPTTFTTKLSGAMSVTVTVDNESTPFKTYDITIIDPTGGPNGTTLTVLRSLQVYQGSSNAVSTTFTNLPTDAGYTVRVDVDTDNGPGTNVCGGSGTYDFTAVTSYPNSTYANPPTCVDSIDQTS